MTTEVWSYWGNTPFLNLIYPHKAHPQRGVGVSRKIFKKWIYVIAFHFLKKIWKFCIISFRIKSSVSFTTSSTAHIVYICVFIKCFFVLWALCFSTLRLKKRLLQIRNTCARYLCACISIKEVCGGCSKFCSMSNWPDRPDLKNSSHCGKAFAVIKCLKSMTQRHHTTLPSSHHCSHLQILLVLESLVLSSASGTRLSWWGEVIGETEKFQISSVMARKGLW